MKILELFSGYGTATFALKRLGITYEVVGYSYIDKYANQCFRQNHGGKELGNVKLINPNDLEDFDLLTGGFPCVPKGTLIQTDKNDCFVPIEKIREGDKVLTHKGRYRKVVKTMNRISKEIYKLKVIGSEEQLLTEEHPLFIKDKGWVKVKDAKIGDLVGINKEINRVAYSRNFFNKNFLWLIGRYLADGYIDSRNRLIFCIGKNKKEEFERNIKNYKYFLSHKDRSCVEYSIDDYSLFEYCSKCLVGSKEKIVPLELLGLPKEYLIDLWEGYFAGDGCVYNKESYKETFSTVSKKLYLGLQKVCIKIFDRTPTFYKRIDNRKETFNDSYVGTMRKNKFGQKSDENYVWVKITSKEKIKWNKEVYNIEVEEDNSYTIDNLIVHNCQAFSVAGKGLGELDPRGTLFYEIIRIAEVKKPKYMLLENVKGLTSKKHKPTFDKILSELNRIGYKVNWKILNTKDYGIPQNRERVWFVCFREQEYYDKFTFPEKEELRIFIKDILEENVDKKYYLSEKLQERFRKYLEDKQKITTNGYETNMSIPEIGEANRIYGVNGVSPPVKASQLKIYESNRVNEIREFENSPTLKSTMGTGGNNVHMVSSTLTTELAHSTGRDFFRSGQAKRIKVASGQLRRLTPKECFRLQGFLNDEVNLNGISDTQCYKLVGNGQTVTVVEKIFRQMFKDMLK